MWFFLAFKLAKYDRIPLGYAQKSVLDLQSERGLKDNSVIIKLKSVQFNNFVEFINHETS